MTIIPFQDVVPATLPFASTLSGSRLWKNTVPLVGWVQKIWPSQVVSRPQVLPLRLLYCSNAEPSGRKRTTPLPPLPKVREPSPDFTSPAE